jgi:hypothetical protein
VNTHSFEDRADAILFELGLPEIEAHFFDLLPRGFQGVVEQGPGQLGLLQA